MPAFTTIIAGVSALAGLGSIKQASDTAAEQRRRLDAQNTAAKESAAQGAQVAGPDAEFVLGAKNSGGSAASNELLKAITGKIGGPKVGGLKGSATKVGGL